MTYRFQRVSGRWRWGVCVVLVVRVVRADSVVRVVRVARVREKSRQR